MFIATKSGNIYQINLIITIINGRKDNIFEANYLLIFFI